MAGNRYWPVMGLVTCNVGRSLSRAFSTHAVVTEEGGVGVLVVSYDIGHSTWCSAYPARAWQITHKCVVIAGLCSRAASVLVLLMLI